MFTYASLSQAIQDYTENDEATFASQIPTFIKFAEERILKATQLEEFQASALYGTVVGDRTITKPCDWLATYSFTLRLPGTVDQRFFLQHKDKSFLDEYWPEYALTDTPRYYADHDVDTFVIAPSPDAIYSVSVSYLRRPESLVDSVDGTWMSTNAPQAILYGALVEAYGFMKGEQDMMAFYDSRFMESIMRMKNLGEALEPDDSLKKSVIRTPPT